MIRKIPILSCSIIPVPIHYDVEIRTGLLDDLNALAADLQKLGSKIALVTNETLSSLYGETLAEKLGNYIETYLFAFQDGEEHKTGFSKEFIENQMFSMGLGRDTCIIALGGGCVLDLAGFIAATFCRGVPLIMIPTSLLGMVDACIGGKTAVNVSYGKNLVGCIYQPKKVIIDPQFLSTLPLQEFQNGIVEMVKHAVVQSSAYFNFLEAHVKELLMMNSVMLEQAIFQSCLIKKTVVEDDEKETGKRRILNFGHTIGHALEKLYKYQLPHGKAVAIGMLVESFLSVELNYMKKEELLRLKALLLKYGLSFHMSKHFTENEILQSLILDKKSIQNIPRFVMINDIGSTVEFDGQYCTKIEESLIRKSIHWMYDDLCAD